MRKTKVIKLLSIAATAAIAPASLSFGAEARDASALANGKASTTSQFKKATLTLASGASKVSTKLAQANNHPFWVGDFNTSWTIGTNWSTGIAPNDPTDSADFVTLTNTSGISAALLNASQTVGTLGFDSAFRQVILPPAAQQTLTITTGLVSVPEGTYESARTYAGTAGHSIGTNIGGSAGLTKTGPGTLILVNFTGSPTITSTFTGAVNINEGEIDFNSNAQLGATTNAVNMATGTRLQMFASTAISSSRPYNLTGNVTIEEFGNLQISGVVAGSGTLNTGLFSGANLRFDSAANTFAGVINVKDNGGVDFGASGALPNVTRYNLGGGLFIPGNANDHILNTADIHMYGGVITQAATVAGGNETMGTLHLASGGNQINVANSTVNNTRGQMTFAGLDRQNRSTLFVQGKGIGTAAGGTANVGNVFFTAAPAGAIGGGGAAGSTNISILPYIAIEPDANVDVSTSGLATYGANGLRTLTAAEYQTSLAAGGATDNYRVTTPQAVAAAKTVNALVLSGAAGPTGGNVSGAGTITVTSGAIMQTAGITTTPLQSISNPINFGGAEGIITLPQSINLSTGNVANGLALSGIITGTNGVTFIGGDIAFGGAPIVLSNSGSSWTGQNRVNMGFVGIAGNVPATGNSPIGASTAPLILSPGNLSINNAGTIGADFFSGIQMLTPGTTYARAINIELDANTSIREGQGFFSNGAADGAGSVIFSGNININNGHLSTLSKGTTTAPNANNLALTGMEFSGVISGNGHLQDQDPFVLGGTVADTQVPVVRLSGTNTYTGGTAINNTVFQVNNNAAFGTGTVSFEGVNPNDGDETFLPFGAIQAFGAPRTLSNPMTYVSGGRFVGNQPLTLTGAQDMTGGTSEIGVDSTADVTISGAMDNGGVFKSGAGRLILSGNNAGLTGQMIVDTGVLSARSNTALGTNFGTLGIDSSNSTFIINTGILELQGSVSQESVLIGSSANGTVLAPLGNVRSVSGTNGIGFLGVNDNANVGVDAGSTLNAGVVHANVGTAEFAVLNKVGTGQLNVTKVTLTDGTFATGMGARNGGINVQAGVLGITPNGASSNVSVVDSLTVAGAAALDLNDNDMIVGASTSSTTIYGYIQSGYNFQQHDGPGIHSSAAAASGGITMLGMLTADEYNANTGGSTVFDGIPVQAGDTLIKYTYYGDVDFNGQVDTTDYNIIDFGFLVGLSGWANGDVDYNGQIDTTDYNLIDFAFLVQSGTLRQALTYLEGGNPEMVGMNDESLKMVIKHNGQFGADYASGMFALVPEPTSLGVVGLAAGALLGRRRRRAAK